MQEEHLKNHSNLAEAFFNQANSDPDRIVYFQAIVDSTDAPNKLRSKRAATYKEVKQTIINVSFFLQQLGVKKGDKVAIISQSRPEWMEADIAALSIGAVVVSVYQSLPWDDIGYILYDSGAKVVFAENQEQVNKLIKLTNEECEIPETEERDATRVKLNFDKIISFESVVQNDLVVEWKSISSINQGSPKLEVDNLKQNDLAALVYTSGTTGPPKGVMQTHGNHLANVRQVITARIVSVDTKIMLFLPLAHSFAKLMGYLGFITPVQLCFPAIVSTENSKIEPESATKDIREANANAVPLVPRLLEKMQSGILQKANSGGLAGFLLNQTINSAKEVYEARSKDCDASIINQVIYALTGFLRKKICRQLFGSEFQYCISGGAKLGIDTAKFFDSLGIQILEGYGLTETCVATNVNRPGRNKVGTVGPLVGDDIDIEIAMDGEILFRGPNVAIGYYGREKASKEAWDENGWFHTGDLG
ncbi:MAG: AMP-binding protein, partial [Bdellovibrionales bacterium]|nr:AMP-binding protein [Bdellovibrionales bacterium]